MVIQRWQSVWLLCAALLMVIFCFTPVFLIEAPTPEHQFITPCEMPIFLVVNILTALLLLVAIFLYRNTARQKSVIVIAAFLIVACNIAEWCMYLGWGTVAEPLRWQGGVFLQLGALLFSILALRCIRHDEKLLRAADRLR